MSDDNEIMLGKFPLLGNITDSDSDSHSDSSEGSSYNSDSDDHLGLFDVYPEFGFDEERYLFVFDPPSANSLTISYQKLASLAKMTSKLFAAWKGRSLADDLQSEQPLTLSEASITSKLSGDYNKCVDDDGHHSEYSQFNLYQLEQEDRAILRAISVKFLLDAMEGEEKLDKFIEKVDRTVTLSEKALSYIVGRCLPMELPYPAMSSIISNLVDMEGLDKVGLMTDHQEESQKDVEQDKEEENNDEDDEDEEEADSRYFYESELGIILNLYFELYGLYDYIKFIMFNFPDEPWKSFIGGCKERFEKRFDEMTKMIEHRIGNPE